MVLRRVVIHMQKKEIGSLPHTTYKNVRVTSIKLLEGNIGINLCDRGLSSGVLHMTPRLQSTKGKK